MKIRKSCHTSGEAASRRRQVHSCRRVGSAGTQSSLPAVLVEGPTSIASRVEELLEHSAERSSSAPQHRRRKVGGRDKGVATRALCSLYALDVEGKPASIETCMHARLTHAPHVLASASWRALAGQGKMASCWSISSFGLECRVAGCLLWAVL